MKKIFLLVFFVFLLSPLILASSVEDEIQRITHYAEEYETGNIDYAKLQLYLSSVRQDLNEILGVSSRDEGGLLNEEQIRKALGEPTEETSWVWVEGHEREKRLEESVPAWNKIIFDGKKIQIRLEAWPYLFNKESIRLKDRIRNFEEEGEFEKAEELKRKLNEEAQGEDDLVYRLHFNIEFKRPQEQLNIQEKISQIKELAQSFSSNPSNENANILAKESVNAERAFESYMRQGQNQCIDIMNSVFGSENQRGTEKLIVKEAIFHSGDNFESIARLEMCDDCEWPWIGLNLWTETRGFNMPEAEQDFDSRPEEYRNLEFNEFETKIKEVLEEYKSAVEQKDFRKANRINQKLWALSDAWNQKSNDVWQEIEKTFEVKRESMTQEQQHEYYSNYGWVKDEQEKRRKTQELAKQNYEKRKAFYNNLLSSYQLRKEFYFEQVSFEKRLVEEFKEFGEEICNNNLDDNKNEQIDCAESQCGGKICGEEVANIYDGNETRTEKINLYCIAGTCQRKQEIIEVTGPVCGNNICEEGEAGTANFSNSSLGTCPQDCNTCPSYPPLECAGRIIFSGQNEQGCSLEPTCVEETLTCNTNEDCIDPLCGDATCVEGTCQVLSLTECREQECVDGQERAESCATGETLVVEICVDGLWQDTNVECESSIGESEIIEEDIVSNECSVESDCGNANDVCSNGRCVTLPQIIEEPGEFEESEVGEEGQEITEEQETREEIQTEEGQEPETGSEEGITGGAVFNFIISLPKKITGAFITGLTSEEGNEGQGSQEDTTNEENNQEESNEGPQDQQTQDGQQQEQSQEGPQQDFEDREFSDENRERERDEDRKEEERDRRENECNERCQRECYDFEIRPCVDKCIFKECGQNFECNVDEVKNSCESSCKQEKNTDSCEKECNEKCMKGEETWKEPEREEHKQEKGVFTVGGSCRTSKGKTEGFIWFGGWGDPFERIQPLKTKYYSGGGDWCKWDLENLIKQRKAFEESFNQEFIEWFFNNYLANSADEWESHISGIFELYWRDVDISREMANRMKCLNAKELPEHNLIGPLIYESNFGSIEFWEEITMGKIDREGEPVPLITPYMKIWIFPSKEIIKLEMKKAMKEHKFPGPQDEGGNQGPDEREKQLIKQDEDFMNKIRKLSDKYGGSFDGALQIVDNGEVIFNVYIRVNENDIISLSPMLPEEVPEKDATIQVEFEKIYELIEINEKEMRSSHLESPPWAPKKIKPVQKVKEVYNGIKMFFKIRSLINSAEVTPSSADGDVKDIIGEVMNMMMGSPGNGEEFKPGESEELQEGESSEEEISSWKSKETLTGNVIG